MPPFSHTFLEGALAGIEFVPASKLGSGDKIPWIWHGWIARGYVTLLVGLWKAGKTTLLAHWLKATANGGDIAGHIASCNVLVIAEEGASLWARRRDEIGFGDNVQFAIRPFKGRPSREQWVAFVQHIASYVKFGGFDVVVIDTWQTINPCPDENDAAGMMAALSPLHHITEAGAGVLLIHHPRKGDAAEGQASRGSGALPGFIDTIAELRRYDAARPDDTRRVIKGLSRFDETPTEVVLDLLDGGFHTIGDKSDVSRDDRLRIISAVLDAANGPLTVEAIGEAWSDAAPRPGVRTLRDDLKNGHEAGHWYRTGEGKKGDPHCFSKFDSRKVHSLIPESNLNSESSG